MQRKAICTIASINYFAQITGLYATVKKYCPEVDFYLLLADKNEDEKVLSEINKRAEGMEYLFVEDINIPDFSNLVKNYTVVDLNTSVKPFFMKWLLENKDIDKLLFMDSDTRLYHSPEVIYEALEDNSIVLTPHIASLNENKETVLSKPDDFCKFGIFNLGFLGLKNDKNAMELLTWWASKMHDKCKLDFENGYAWDQKWLDFAPGLFEGVYVLKHIGCNVAFWNIQGRFISEKNGEYFVNDEVPLIFYHFSHHRVKDRANIISVEEPERNIPVTKRPDLVKLYEDYDNKLIEDNYFFFNAVENGYDLVFVVH
ncbi:MAG: hypothetical protein K6D02_06130 [Lachnospiraceae bacterium]|nr:hypothetical protein [Lachnospiraceae bacterium]